MLSYPVPPKLPQWTPGGLHVEPRSLLTFVPADRTCEQAGVPADVCPCTKQEVTSGAATTPPTAKDVHNP